MSNVLYDEFYTPQDNVDSTIDEQNDEMLGLNGSKPHYFAVGQSMLKCVKLALLAANKPDSQIKRILDLPCGHGRMLRTLKAAYPEAEITASDINEKGVEFCAKQFGAIPILSKVNPEEIPFGPVWFDLIYVGSLFTHLPEQVVVRFMHRLSSVLVKGGVMLFSTCGRYIASTYQDNPQHQQLLQDYAVFGFGYEPYPPDKPVGYGSTLSKPSWVMGMLENMSSLRILYFWERGLDRYQDIAAVIKD